MTTTAVRLPDDLYQQLEEVARARKRPKGAILREALEAYLELRADYEIAVDRMQATMMTLRDRAGVAD